MTQNSEKTLYTCLLIGALSLTAVSQDGQDLQQKYWIANAIRWTSVWGADEINCQGQVDRLSSQIARAKGHPFSLEMKRYPDGMIALMPELHRAVSIKLTNEGGLGSISVEKSCAASFQEFASVGKSLPHSTTVNDVKAQEQLQRLDKQVPVSPSSSGTVTTDSISISTKSERAVSNHSLAEGQALQSMASAAQSAFNEFCSRGQSASLEIPHFQLDDPEVISVLTTKATKCVLPMAFEYRKSSSDPYVAYAQKCVEDENLWKKSSALVRQNHLRTLSLRCSAEKN